MVKGRQHSPSFSIHPASCLVSLARLDNARNLNPDESALEKFYSELCRWTVPKRLAQNYASVNLLKRENCLGVNENTCIAMLSSQA